MMKGVWIIGAVAFMLFALLLALVKFGKVRFAVADRLIWLMVLCNLLLGIDMLVHFFGFFHDKNSSVGWMINIAFLLLLIPVYYFALESVRKQPHVPITQSQDIGNEPQHIITPESQDFTSPPEPQPLSVSHSQDLAKPDTSDLAIPESKIAKWVSERHFTDPNITLDKALLQMNISLSVFSYYLEQRTESGSFRKWLQSLRLEEAKRMMLEKPYFTIQAIAEECGYSNNQSLTKAFKLQEGVPPSVWMSKQKQQS